MKKYLLTLLFILVLGFSFAQQTNHWTSITGTQYNMTMSGIISIDGVVQTSTSLEIGAFCDDECRGSARAQLFPPTGDYVVCLAVVSNEVNGETITFRLFDHSIQQEFPSECINSITFSANDNLGGMGNWYPFDFVEESNATQTIELVTGWNWISTYIEAEDPVELLQMLEAALGENGLVIKSMDDYTTYEDGEWGAMGDLDEEGIVNEQMYAIQVGADCTVQLQGLLANPDAHAITIYPGWNWIGFPIDQAMSIEDALSDYAPEDGDVIKDMEDYSSYVDGWGDTGDLEELTPGHGYKYFSNSSVPKFLVFSADAKKVVILREKRKE